MVRNLFAAAVLAILAVPASAMTLKDFTVGKTVSGPALTVPDMKGKVVLLMYWGTH